MKPANRFFFLIFIFLIILLANSCDDANKDNNALQISLVEDVAGIAKISKDDKGVSTVSILETAIGNSGIAANNTFASYNKQDVLKPIFAVSIKDATKGILFATDLGVGADEITHINQMRIPVVAATEAAVAANNQSFFVNSNPAKIISAWITRGFGEATPASGLRTSIGFVCQTTFTNLSKENILKETEADLSGGHSSTCSIGATQNLAGGGWVTAAANTPNSSASINLVFGGLNTGDKEFKKLGNNVDLTNGLLLSEMKTLSRDFPNSILKVKVEIVSSL